MPKHGFTDIFAQNELAESVKLTLDVDPYGTPLDMSIKTNFSRHHTDSCKCERPTLTAKHTVLGLNDSVSIQNDIFFYRKCLTPC